MWVKANEMLALYNLHNIREKVDNMDIEKNDVLAKGQVKDENKVFINEDGGKLKVLFIGNSITRHEPKPEIGWDYDWGMAASKLENDYVHVAVKLLEEKFGEIDYAVVNCGEWEINYYKNEGFSKWEKARNFNADIVVVRIGENIFNAHEEFDNHPIAPYFAKMIEYFSFGGKAKVVLTDLFWKNETINNAIYKVAEENGYPLVKLGDLGDSDENKAIGQFWHAGVALHPNDQGMKKIAERIVDSIFEEYTPLI